MKSGIKTIIAGISLFILGAVVVPLAVVLPLILGDSNEEQFKVPGNTQIVIEEPGRYYLWNNYKTVLQGKTYNSSESTPDGIQIKIRNGETGELFDFVGDSSMALSTLRNMKTSIGYIEAQEGGSLHIDVEGGNEERVFSLSKFSMRVMFGLIFGVLGLSLIICCSGFGVLAWGILRAAKSKQTAR